MFYQKNHNLISIDNMDETSDFHQRESQPRSKISYNYIRTSVSENDSQKLVSPPEKEPVENIDEIKNYSKAPIYTHVNTRKRKMKMENPHAENEISPPCIVSDHSQMNGKQQDGK